MTRDVLHAQARFHSPAAASQSEHQHPEWTNFDGLEPHRRTRTRTRSSTRNSKSIRARKNTTIHIVDGKLRLVFSGNDPGIAMDLRRNTVPPEPYRVTFRLRGGSVDGGELFFTTDAKTTLPCGTRIAFDVKGDGNWQNVKIELPTSKPIQQLRLDVSTGAGKALIRELRRSDTSGKPLLRWPIR